MQHTVLLWDVDKNAPGNTIITLFSSCDVWREQGEAREQPQTPECGSCPGTKLSLVGHGIYLPAYLLWGCYCCVRGSRLVDQSA